MWFLVFQDFTLKCWEANNKLYIVFIYWCIIFWKVLSILFDCRCWMTGSLWLVSWTVSSWLSFCLLLYLAAWVYWCRPRTSLNTWIRMRSYRNWWRNIWNKGHDINPPDLYINQIDQWPVTYILSRDFESWSAKWFFSSVFQRFATYHIYLSFHRISVHFCKYLRFWYVYFKHSFVIFYVICLLNVYYDSNKRWI